MVKVNGKMVNSVVLNTYNKDIKQVCELLNKFNIEISNSFKNDMNNKKLVILYVRIKSKFMNGDTLDISYVAEHIGLDENSLRLRALGTCRSLECYYPNTIITDNILFFANALFENLKLKSHENIYNEQEC